MGLLSRNVQEARRKILLLYFPQLPIPCYFPAFGNRISGNVFLGNGFFGNETNGDLANAVLGYPTNNCFQDNINLKTWEPTSSPQDLQSSSVAGTCGKAMESRHGTRIISERGTRVRFPRPVHRFAVSLESASGLSSSDPGKVVSHRARAEHAGPCEGVPANTWCPGKT
jgi:hypothetical protein